MNQVNVKYFAGKKSRCEQGVTDLNIEVIEQKNEQSFMEAVGESKKINIITDSSGVIRMFFKEGNEVVDNYTMDELFDLLKLNKI